MNNLKEKNVIVIHILYSTFYNDGRVKNYYNYLLREGIKSYIISIDDEIQENIFSLNSVKKYQGSSLLAYGSTFAKFINHTLKSIKIIRELNKDAFFIYHVHNMPNITTVLPKFYSNGKDKIILDNHDILPLVVEEKFKSSLLKFIASIEQTIAVKLSDRIICADDIQKEYLEKNLNIEVTPILNLPRDIFIPGKKDNPEFNMVYHGTISHRLGIDLILQAINLVKDKLKNFKFHLIGPGDFVVEIIELVKKLGLENLIIVYNKSFPVESLPGMLQQMDIGIIGNRKTKLADFMLPVKLMEYVQMEIPVITPRNKIITQYFEEDMLCFYEPENIKEMSEKILMLYEDENLRKEFSQKALSFISKYNYETEMKKYQNVLNELVY